MNSNLKHKETPPTVNLRSYTRRASRNRHCNVYLDIVVLGAVFSISCDVNLTGSEGAGQPIPTERLAVSPVRAPVIGETRVTVTGIDAPAFGSETQVLFNGTLATELQVINASTMSVIPPPNPAGPAEVEVRSADGESITFDGFEYVAVIDADTAMRNLIKSMFPGAPHLVSAVATSNTGVRVTFSEPVLNGVLDTSNYSIVIDNGGVLLLDDTQIPILSDDATYVELTTLSQAAEVYRLTVGGIHDLSGNPIAPPDILINPAETVFTGIPPGHVKEHIDSDGDGFADWFEMLGWQITTELTNGHRIQAYVTSDPFNPDTDGDGVLDGEENARSMDPRTDDTDADLVPDAEEIWEWHSDPCDQDSDDDGFSDDMEKEFGTSLILADTDGDQLDDRDEMLNRNRNPLIADLPVLKIAVGEMNLQLDQRYSYTDQFGEEQQLQESFSDTLQRDTSSSEFRTRSNVHRAHVEAKLMIKGGYEKGGYGGFEAEAAAGYAYEHTHAWGHQSSVSASRTYNEALTRVSQISSTSGVSRETVGAKLSAAVTISAASDIAFQVSDIEISVLQQDPEDRSRLIPMASLVPRDPEAIYSVGPLIPEVGPLIFENTEIFPKLVEELMKDPSGLVFKVVNFDITDELERNFAFSSQEVIERTAMITIDYGNGESQTSRIATAGRFTREGVPLGITMEAALNRMYLSPREGEDVELGSVDDPNDTRPKPTDPEIHSSFGMCTVSTTGDDDTGDDVRVITRVRGVQDDFDRPTVEPEKPNDGGFWVVFVSSAGNFGEGGGGPSLRAATNFDEARLHAGENYILAYVKDKDRDQLTSLEEFYSGSSDARSDTDGDNLGDFLEVYGQWNVDGLGAWLVYTDQLPGGYRAYSAPYLADSDEDKLSDDIEYALCRYGYANDGTPPPEVYTSGTYPDNLIDPSDSQVAWDYGISPGSVPAPFQCEGLPENWYTDLNSNGLPTQFPSNRASLDPRKSDTDEDGITDGDEVNGYYVDIFDDDPNDGVRHLAFVFSDPLSTDTDGDGLSDGMERQFGTNPVSLDSNTVFDDDLDGLPNRVEQTGWQVTINGIVQTVLSDPNDPDSDDDNIPDYVEWVLGTNPWKTSSQTIDPNAAAPGYDTDTDGLSDYDEWDGSVPPQDLEKLAFCDFVPNCAGRQPSATAHGTDPKDADTDDDGLNDGAELEGWIVHLGGSPGGYRVFSDPLNPDSDNDGWPDGKEEASGADPGKPDTDDDGTIDSIEDTICDTQGRSRDPLTPDQRVSVTYLQICTGKIGNPNHKTAPLQFNMELWIPGVAHHSCVSSGTMLDWSESLFRCFSDYDCLCAACDWTHIRVCENDCLLLLGFSGVPYDTRKSLVLEHGDFFWILGNITWRESCNSANSYSWDFGMGNDRTVPVSAGSFQYDVDFKVTDTESVQLSVHGYIAVD